MFFGGFDSSNLSQFESFLSKLIPTLKPAMLPNEKIEYFTIFSNSIFIVRWQKVARKNYINVFVLNRTIVFLKKIQNNV